jgi:hypothetical protein
VLIIWESSIGAFLIIALYLIYLAITLAYHYFLHLLSTNHKCTQPCYFPLLYKPAAQKLKKIWSIMIWSSRWVIAPDRLPVQLWCLSAAMLPRVFDLVFCKTIFGDKYYILWHWLFFIHFLYGMCVNLIPGKTYYEHSVLAQKLGVTEWYLSCVDRRNASLVRRVIF